MMRIVLCALVSCGCCLSTGCWSSRPSNVAATPGDCFCELSNPDVQVHNGEIRFKVRYTFPDGPPKYDAWFMCTFDISSNSVSSVSVRKMGKDLGQTGEFEGLTNASFLRIPHGAFAAQVKQAESKNGPYREVSTRIVSEF